MDKNEYEKAKRTAFRLLKFRARSESELVKRLQEKQYAPEVINEILAGLKKARLIDDKKFTRDWIEFRLEKSFSLKRIAGELNDKGIDPNLIEEELSNTRKVFNEHETLDEFIRTYTTKHKHEDTAKLKIRLFSTLVNKGFSEDSVHAALEKL